MRLGDVERAGELGRRLRGVEAALRVVAARPEGSALRLQVHLPGVVATPMESIQEALSGVPRSTAHPLCALDVVRGGLLAMLEGERSRLLAALREIGVDA